MTRSPIACSLSPDDLEVRRATLLPGMVARATERVRLDHGFRWRFVADDSLLADLAAMIETERHCCRFLEFRILIEPEHGPIVLEVTGPPGTAEFLEHL